MDPIIIVTIIFFLLCLCALGTMFFHRKLKAHHYDDETAAVVRLVANIFVVMTSLVFGLMMNSAKNTYETVDKNVHAFATSIIVLNSSLKSYGPETADSREKLCSYV